MGDRSTDEERSIQSIMRGMQQVLAKFRTGENASMEVDREDIAGRGTKSVRGRIIGKKGPVCLARMQDEARLLFPGSGTRVYAAKNSRDIITDVPRWGPRGAPVDGGARSGSVAAVRGSGSRSRSRSVSVSVAPAGYTRPSAPVGGKGGKQVAFKLDQEPSPKWRRLLVVSVALIACLAVTGWMVLE